jgi:hypothetical protein
MERMGSARSLLLSAALLCACSPALDWRQVTPAELGVLALFPCRPASLARQVLVLQQRSPMVMHACSAAGNTFAVSGLSMGDVRDVAPAIVFLRDAAFRNLGAVGGAAQPVAVPGMTPNAQAGRFVLRGQRPDGSAVTEHLLLFAHGARIYQASVVGDAPDEAAVATFFAGLRVTP